MRPSTLQPLRLLGGVALLLGALSTQAAFDAFLMIEGIPGEGTDSRHAGWIEVHSLHFGLAGPSALEPTQLGPLTVRKGLDKASPLLARACATGQHIPRVKLELVRTSVKQSRFYQVILDNVLVTGLDVSGEGADAQLAETVELTAARWSWSYTEYELDGQWLQDLGSYWDVVGNAGDGSITPAMRTAGSPTADGGVALSFYAKAGVTYRILAGPDPLGDYFETQRLEPAEGGERTVIMPAIESRRFFLVEELP